MKLVIFGLSVSSSWGNGHATLWRGLVESLSRRGHRVVFFEKDVPYYRDTRDLDALEAPAQLVLYPDWEAVRGQAARHLRDTDAALVTSYCPDGVAAARLVLDSPAAVRAFYDLDTPVTLARLDDGQRPPYLPPEGLGGFDLVLSYTGGRALDALRDRLGARDARPLYGSVDPAVHAPAPPRPEFQADLSYLGTWAADRQAALDALFLEPARRRPDLRFVIGGAQYPEGFPWTDNLMFVRHLPPSDHAAFYAASPLTVNVTRGPMAAMGWCPSARLFEAAACGTPVLSDLWDGLDHFFDLGDQLLPARTADDTLAALELGPERLAAIGRRARERVLAEHTAAHRADELLDLLSQASTRRGDDRPAASAQG